MSRRGTLALLIIVSMALVGGMAQAQTTQSRAGDLTGLLLTWQEDPTTTMTVDWHWLDLRSGSERTVPEPIMHYREHNAAVWRTIEGTVLRPILPGRALYRAEITGLLPDTAYEFRLEGDERVYRFVTMPETLHEPLRFAMGGDTRHRQDWMEEMNRVIMAYDPAFIVWGGDLAYADGVRADYWLEWYAAAKNTLIKDDGTVIPVITGIGNHEVQQHWYRNHSGYEETEAWRERIAPFFYGLLAFPGQPGYSVLDFGDYLSLVVLDTDHTNSVTGAQATWLEDVLAERRDVQHVIPVYHVTAFPSVRAFGGTTETRIRDTWLPLFEKYGVRLAFENHDHAFKRTVPILKGEFDPAGIVYFGDGAWGVTPRDIHSVNNTWYLDRAVSTRFGMIVTLNEAEVHVLSVASDGQVIDDYTVNGLYVESPAKASTVGADEPVRVWIDPSIDVTEIQVGQNGVEIYRGKTHPEQLTLSATVVNDDLPHELTVIVTDSQGRVRQQRTHFTIQPVYLRAPKEGTRVRGNIAVEAAIGLGPGEAITQVEMSVQRIKAFEDTEAVAVYEGTTWPGRLMFDTLCIEDGTYDLTLTVSTDEGRTYTDMRRIVVRNWDILVEPFEAPTEFFGLSFDRLKTKDRSDGWTSATDRPHDFHGEANRLVPPDNGDSYLTWQHPRLRRYAFTLFVSHEAAVRRIKVAVSDDMTTWHDVPFTVDFGERSDAGWLKVILQGDVDEQLDANYIRFTWRGPGLDESSTLQLGHAEIVGTSG